MLVGWPRKNTCAFILQVVVKIRWQSNCDNQVTIKWIWSQTEISKRKLNFQIFGYSKFCMVIYPKKYYSLCFLLSTLCFTQPYQYTTITLNKTFIFTAFVRHQTGQNPKLIVSVICINFHFQLPSNTNITHNTDSN